MKINQVIVRPGRNRVEKKMEHSKQSISVMFCGSTDGTYLPLMVVYQVQNVYGNWTEGGPHGTIYDCTTSRWFDSVTFEKWFFKFFLPNACALNGPVASIGDNLGSHFLKAVVDACLQNNIMFNTTTRRRSFSSSKNSLEKHPNSMEKRI